MPVFKVKVKWGRELFPNIEVNTDEEPLLFKAQLFALTGVHPERQKVLFKGSILNDNVWNLDLKDGVLVLLMGSKEQVPEKPSELVGSEENFESDNVPAIDLPAGLTNLGNTCYMNATVQCLRAVPELRDSLDSFHVVANDAPSLSYSITSALKYLFNHMERGSTVTPIILLQTLHRASPQFSQTGENGSYRQQDANECWSELLKMLQQNLPIFKRKDQVEQIHKYNSFIEQFFGGSFEVTMQCNESEIEEPTSSIENFLQLSCFISTEVKYMQSGLKSKMKEILVKRSETLNRDATYTKSSLICRLPAYLTIQFVRFQYKSREGINAKVLKDIKFPIEFDAYELCSPELQKKLNIMREKFKKFFNGQDESNTSDILEKCNTKSIEKEPYWFEDDYGSNSSGYYVLQAVLTHKGRSSSSGHYVAWVRQNGDLWFKFDDDVVSSVTTEEILRLSGGGDWHSAYVLLYAPKQLPKTV